VRRRIQGLTPCADASECDHSDGSFDCRLDAPGLETSEQRFGVGLPTPAAVTVLALQRGSDLLVVVDLALEDDRESPVHRSHRLVANLGRDRMGGKPLYYGWQRNCFVFASDLKALRAHPAFCGEIDRAALTAVHQILGLAVI